jgi:hypothetical protein
VLPASSGESQGGASLVHEHGYVYVQVGSRHIGAIRYCCHSYVCLDRHVFAFEERRYPIFSAPTYRAIASGSSTLPSGCWYVSNSAASVRGNAKPEPFSV